MVGNPEVIRKRTNAWALHVINRRMHQSRDLTDEQWKSLDLSDPEGPQRIADQVQSRGIHVRRREHSEGFRSKMCGRLPRTLARSSGNLAVETISKGSCGSVSWDGNGKNGPPLSFEVVLFGPFTWVQ
jgi:hypothetical protein